MYLTGAILKDKKLKRVSLLLLKSYLITGVTSQVVKSTFSRHRPLSGDSFDQWDGPKIDRVHTSFFSGHSSIAFSFATVFAEEFKYKKWVPPLAYSLASLTTLSRVHDNAHWASDVFIGSAMGYFITKMIVKNHSQDKDNKLSFSPVIGRGNNKLNIIYSF